METMDSLRIRFLPRWAAVLLAGLGGLFASACASSDATKSDEVTNIVTVGVGAEEDQPALGGSDVAKRVRNTAESVKRYEELKLQGNSRAMIALRTTIARTVDEDFNDYRDMALTLDSLVRNEGDTALIARPPSGWRVKPRLRMW